MGIDAAAATSVALFCFLLKTRREDEILLPKDEKAFICIALLVGMLVDRQVMLGGESPRAADVIVKEFATPKYAQRATKAIVFIFTAVIEGTALV
jgi:hypothetical protein